MNNIIEVRLVDLNVRKELTTIREMMLKGSSREYSNCPICACYNINRCYKNQVSTHMEDELQTELDNEWAIKYSKWGVCKPCIIHICVDVWNYDWDTLEFSLIHEGYSPTKYKDGYITIRNKMVVDGSHRVTLLKEIYDNDYKVKVINND